MLFNSQTFIFGFLPIVVCVFFIAARFGQRFAAASLAAASVVFYGAWNKDYVVLLLFSIFFNYCAGYIIGRARAAGRVVATRCALTAGITVDLLLLGYYKYYNFLLGSLAAALGSNWTPAAIILPLGISFFTFTQIAFLVDAAQGKAEEYNPIYYTLFVTFFPHLIAGPILHHREMMPQFGKAETYRVSIENFAIGTTIFIIGLFKKVVLADNLISFVGRVFEANPGTTFGLADAWIGTIAYALQLYFDFSGYSDMAVGLSRLFGIKLPINFNSPYKATSIIEFWRCWHMTLSRFLRDYLYIPLGGNRSGPWRRYLNMFVTMCLGGLWHGAGWTYVAWGALHGVFLIVNHGWRHSGGVALSERLFSWAYLPLCGLATFASVCVGWVFFRADDISAALAILRGMSGMNGLWGPTSTTDPVEAALWLGPLMGIVWLLPNAYEFLARVEPALIGRSSIGRSFVEWRPTLPFAILAAIMVLACLPVLRRATPFLYFQF